MKILAIETSCDDSGIAILGKDENNQLKIMANLVSSQTKIHAPWGGVVPTLAKREHQRNLTPLLIQALKKSNLLLPQLFDSAPQNARLRSENKIREILSREPDLLKKLLPFLKKYQKPAIDVLVVTVGPGLEPALWVGVNFARALAYFWNLPVIPINHLEGHMAAGFFQLEKTGGTYNLQATSYKLLLPAVCLVVSGGHTSLFLMKKFGRFEIIGETRDDAAGEAFDKAAKMLNLGYPGGPAIAKIAAKFKPTSYNLQATIYKLPRPMINSGDFDFSFSGLKTALLYQLQKMASKEIKEKTPALCAEFQQAAADVLVSKTIKAAQKFNAKTVLISGGVAANELLRQTLAEKLKKEAPKISFLSPAPKFCTDNAAMIGLAAFQKSRRKSAFKSWRALRAQANLRL